MAVPKRRKSSSKRDMRRAQHDKVEAPKLASCPNCSAPVVSHRVCPSCGYYKGRLVLAGAGDADAEVDESTETEES